MYNTLGIKLDMGMSRTAVTTAVIKQIFKCDGISGFYRGYTASLCTYVPNSALWWACYHFYQGECTHYCKFEWFDHGISYDNVFVRLLTCSMLSDADLFVSAYLIFNNVMKDLQ